MPSAPCGPGNPGKAGLALAKAGQQRSAEPGGRTVGVAIPGRHRGQPGQQRECHGSGALEHVQARKIRGGVPAERVIGLAHRRLAVGQGDVQVVDVDVVRAEVVVRRDLVLNDPPRLGHPRRPVTVRYRRGGRAHQLDGQARLLGHLSQGGLGLGFLLLTLTLVSGIFFSESIFGKPLTFNHKTVFSILAWCVFGGLLLGRQRYGWRGRVALRWILTGTTLLFLAYLGSKFVLEVLLHR